MKKLFLFTFISLPIFAQNIPVFNAKSLYALTDGELASKSFYSNNYYDNPQKNDFLTSLNFPVSVSESRNLTNVLVSNSILNNQQNFVKSKKTNLLYIIESYGKERESKSTIEESLKKGQFVTIVSMANPSNPLPIFKFQVGLNPTSISLSPTEEYLAITCEEYGNELMIYELDELGKPIRKIKKPSSLTEGKIVDLQWHPTADFLIYTNESEHHVGLIKILRDGPTNKIIRLQTYGNTISVGQYPMGGRFVLNNKYFIVADLKKRKNNIESNQKSEIFLIKFNFEEEFGTHYLLSKIEIGENLQSFVIQNEKLATLHLNHSYYENETNQDLKQPVVQLIKINEDGSFQKLSETKVEGSFCSGLQFDNEATNLAYGITEYTNLGLPIGGIDFIKIEKNSSHLVPQHARVIMPSGLHTLIKID